MNLIYFRKNYKIADCSCLFLIFYGVLRIISEFFREPDAQIGLLFGSISMGMALSAIMICAGTFIYIKK